MTTHCPCGSGWAIETDGKCGQCRHASAGNTATITTSGYVYVHPPEWSSITVTKAENGYLATHRGKTYVFAVLDDLLLWLKERL